ncbi:MAG: inositol monophosphatase family protein [Archaeoglobales archaeon]|nr:inositol monophosphatase family protein [Archaeoglobales archaeon]
MEAEYALRISRNVAKAVRKAVAQLSLEQRKKVVGNGVDGSPSKLVDVVAERAALEILLKEKVTILSEEKGFVGEGDTYVALDPIDGTFNAERGIPFYSVSICFSDSESLKDTFFGYVYSLESDEEYFAAEGEAFKNEKMISVSKKDDLTCDAIFYYPTKLLPFKRIRIFGSAALELCYIAEGRFDCFVDVRNMLRVFDVAAGIFIVKCAGGKVTDNNGLPLDNKKIRVGERINIVAANPSLHKKLMELIK